MLVPVHGWRWGDRLRQAIPCMVALGRRSSVTKIPRCWYQSKGGAGETGLGKQSSRVGASPRVALGRQASASNPRHVAPGVTGFGKQSQLLIFVGRGDGEFPRCVWGGWGWMAGLVRGAAEGGRILKSGVQALKKLNIEATLGAAASRIPIPFQI